jgi:antitoxin (DNA-binding transcriptional repressor) of toxin-antitoxin stability system
VISLSIMNTVNIADLRNNFRRVSAWIENGESVKILRRGNPYAILSPLPQDTQSQPVQVDFAAQRRTIWRGRRFSAEEVAEMRDAELGCEE